MKIAITGATGFIGKHLVEYLSQNNHELLILSRQNSGQTKPQDKNVNVQTTDFTFESLEKQLIGIEQIVHLAGQRMPKSQSYVGLNHFFESNISMTENILRAAQKNNVKRVIFASTLAIYGKPRAAGFWTEDDKPKPLNNYAFSKLICEQLLQLFSHQYQIETVSLRLAQVIGAGEREDLIIANFIKKCLQNHQITISKTGFQGRDYIYVKDLVRLFNKIVLSKEIDAVYNVGGDRPINALEIAEQIKKVLNSSSEIIVDKKDADNSNMLMNSEKVSEHFDWRTTWTIEEAITDIVNAKQGKK